MRLYGTITSPFVRRVRAVAHEVGEPVELVDPMSPDGQRALRAVSPIWKVPAGELDGRVLWDSAILVDELLARRGAPASFRAATTTEDRLFVAAVDEALLALIRIFYLQRDGLDVRTVPYLVKERDRTDSIFAWVEGSLRGPWCTGADGFGRAELALFSALEWIRFRKTWDVEAHPGLVAFLEAHRARPSLAATPPTG